MGCSPRDTTMSRHAGTYWNTSTSVHKHSFEFMEEVRVCKLPCTSSSTGSVVEYILGIVQTLACGRPGTRLRNCHWLRGLGILLPCWDAGTENCQARPAKGVLHESGIHHVSKVACLTVSREKSLSNSERAFTYSDNGIAQATNLIDFALNNVSSLQAKQRGHIVDCPEEAFECVFGCLNSWGDPSFTWMDSAAAV